MIKRKKLPRPLSLFEFFEKSGIFLKIKLSEGTFRKEYTEISIPGYTLFENVNRGYGRSEPTYPDAVIKTYYDPYNQFIELISGRWLHSNGKQIVKIPELSFRSESDANFNFVRVVSGKKAINILNFIKNEKLEFVISEGEDAHENKYFIAEIEHAKVDGFSVIRRGRTEKEAISALINLISQKTMVVCGVGYNVPALYL